MNSKSGIQILALCLLLNACKTSNTPVSIVTQPTPPALIQLGGQAYSAEDFVNSYDKNKYLADTTQALGVTEYIDLYTNLKLKILDAVSEGRDTTNDFKQEIATYQQQLARPYLTNKESVENLKKEAYQRMQEELHVSHILTSVAQDASPEDTLKAFQAATAMIGRLKEGADFGEMAERFSADKASSSLKGDLGYFTAFQMVYPFENAAYELKAGEISDLVRSRFGYHIIKLHNRRPARGKVQVAHLMVREDAKQPASSRNKITEVYEKLKNGGNWEELVQFYSDDMQSRRNGGALPVFGTGEMVGEFENAAFALLTPGQYSQPVHTKYGWHIVRLMRRIPILSYQELEQQIHQKVNTDTRGRLLESQFASQLSKEYSVLTNQALWNQLLDKADQSVVTKPWNYTVEVAPALKATEILKIENQSIPVSEFFEFVNSRKENLPAESSPQTVLNRYFKEFRDRKLINFESNQLERKYPEFRQLMQEIREGVLLSQVMEKNVWGKSLVDSVGQYAFYTANQGLFKMGERADAILIEAPDAQTLDKLKELTTARPYQLEIRSNEVLFNHNQIDITPAIKDQLLSVRAIMVKNSGYILEVAAFRSKDESDSVSATRLRNVINYFTSSGIPLTRIIEKDHGPFRPLADNNRNQRVSFQFYSNSSHDLEKAFIENTKKQVKVMDGFFLREAPELSDIKWQTGEQLLNKEMHLKWVNIRNIEPDRVKTFKESRGSVINAYQQQLEDQWINSLKNRYPVKINEEELKKIVDKP